MSKKLLLADDSVTIQRVIELTFSGEDVQVLTASDGEEALTRIATDKPDIVLADIGMPKRSGYDVSAFVKGQPELSHIPVLLLAGAFEPVDDAKAREVHCDGVLVKPFEPQQVIARVRELIGGAKGSPTQPAVSDIPRPAAVLTASRPVELPRREEKPAVLEDLMEFGVDDLVPRTGRLARSTEELLSADDFLPPVESLDSTVPPLALDDSLDDYFDKLDEAFATITTSSLDTTTSPASDDVGRREGPVLERELDSFDELPPLDALPDAGPAHNVDPFQALDAIHPDDAAVPTLDDLLAGMSPRPKPAAAVAPPVIVTPPPVEPPKMTPTLTVGPASLEAPPVAGRSIVADAFSALLAIEQGEPGVVPVRIGGNGSPPVITEPMIDDVARRVIQKLALGSSDQMHTIVKEIVSAVAERLVREEIDRIRRNAPRS
jgi:CheY-like chemotaxis protein